MLSEQRERSSTYDDMDDRRETWPTPPPTLPSRKNEPIISVQRVHHGPRRSCLDLVAWITSLRTDETTRPISLEHVLEEAISAGASSAYVVRQLSCSAALDGHPERLVRFFAGIIADVVAGTAAQGASAHTILVRVDVEGPRTVVVEIADLRRVIGSTCMDSSETAIEIVRASDALLGITISADRDPLLGTVVRVEMPAHPRL